MTGLALATSEFVRQHVRNRVTLVMLVVIPALFVVFAASALGELSKSLGGDVTGSAATSLGAGWASAFLGGILGFFQVSSSRDSDRRLSLAGMGGTRVALARIGACIALSLLAALVAFFVLWADTGIDQPGRALAAILAFGFIYVGIGALVGSLVHDELTGSLIVALVFIMDIYAGPGMSGSSGTAKITPTRKSSEVLMSAVGGAAPSTADWLAVGGTALGALLIAFAAFWFAARPRT
ncbi:MAG TPA: hypothetical protein VFH38_04150 [Jatrophihabitans sp.]|nr:hypothetical protein [Jatrophihabitans sp.]